MEPLPEGTHTIAPPDPETSFAPPREPYSPVASLRRDILYALAAAFAYLLFQQFVVYLRVTNGILLTGLSLVSLLITLLFTVRMTRALRSPLSQGLSLAITAAVMLPFVLLPFIPLHTRAQLLTAQRIWSAYSAFFGLLPGLRGLLLICLAVSFGVVISRLVREVKILLPIAVVLAMVDLYVVFGGGLVTQAKSGKVPVAQAAMSALTVSLTPRMPRGVPSPPPLAVGFADFLFIALFFACFVRFQIPERNTFVILCGVLCAYMLAVVIGKLDLPALVPIAVVVIGNNLRFFRYERSEAFALLYAGLIVGAVLSAAVVLSHH